jgi:hypothetical protein
MNMQISSQPEIPSDLRSKPHWVGYRSEGSHMRDWVPVNPQTAEPSNLLESSTWGTLEEAEAVVRRHGLDGVGYVLTADDGIVVLSLRDWNKPTPEVPPPAIEQAQKLNSYTEITSGNGVCIFLRGSLSSGERCRGAVEICGPGRFIPVTGKRIESVDEKPISAAIEPRQSHIDKFAALMNGQQSHGDPAPVKTAKMTSEQYGELLAGYLKRYIAKNDGRYLRDESGALFVVLRGRRIALNRDPENYGLARLVLNAANISTLGGATQVAIQRLQVHADEEAKRLHFRRFSALSPDRKRLYVPLANGGLLRITGEEIVQVANADNADDFWIEHPNGEPFVL